MIFGFQPQNNSAFDEIFSSLQEDAKLCEDKPLESKRVSAVFNHLNSLMDSKETQGFGSLATIGLIDLMLSKQEIPSDQQLEIFEKAVGVDPLSEHSERVEVKTNLTNQLRADVSHLLTVKKCEIKY